MPALATMPRRSSLILLAAAILSGMGIKAAPSLELLAMSVQLGYSNFGQGSSAPTLTAGAYSYLSFFRARFSIISRISRPRSAVHDGLLHDPIRLPSDQ